MRSAYRDHYRITYHAMNIDQFKKIWEHAQLSPYAGTLKHPSMSGTQENPLCGDTLRIDLAIKRGVVTDAKFAHHGCALSATAASLLLENIIGKKASALRDLDEYIVLKLIGAPVSPARLNCALLPLRVMRSMHIK